VVNQAQAAELTLSRELAQVAAKPEYASALAAEDIGAAFIAGFLQKIGEGEALMSGAVGKTADKESITQREDGLKEALLAEIGKVQTRAKRKYKPGDPMRAEYFIGKAIEPRRALLETSTRAILTSLAADTLPGMKAEDTTALQGALDAYLGVQTEQTGGQSGATTGRDLLEAKVKEIADLRRQIQYAADTLWPAAKKTNAGIRTEFKIPADRKLN
jgi:hypothetical protein